MLYSLGAMFFLAVSAVFCAMPVPSGTVTRWFVTAVAFPMRKLAVAVDFDHRMSQWEASESRMKHKMAVAIKRLFYVR